ncbi:transcriptional regulator [Microlunatus endophyticus]|uniref:Transcriptional regulator n=1 Tax=Microlunatus endophyticus TaxID=1716077 RepID=A0A917W6J7_9ACTN|nr:transcriptional regulator [Microlunatus endophyticus]
MTMCHAGRVTITFGLDPVRAEVNALIERMRAGEVIDSMQERKSVDLKEEAGRRGRDGAIKAGDPENEQAAQKLAAEAACMANTPGGGALIVGVGDDGTLIGADLDAEWLRQRIYQVTQRLLTVDVSEVDVCGTRLLVVISPYAVEPVRINNRITWRVNDGCVEVDGATWHARRMQTLKYDWSGDASSIPSSAVRPQALAVARDFLLASGDAGAEDLAQASDSQLLRRLNVVTEAGFLTHGGALAFVGRDTPSLDYIHREYAGGDSTARVRRPDRSLLEELSEVFLTMDAHNTIRHVQSGLIVRQVRDIPVLAAREAVVNGVAHREWGLPSPTVVEHVGRTLRVTSPGGFYGGVNESNIITHPSQSRNPALTQLLADLRVAEREGIGVDRMVREMIRVGHQPPAIREISGPFVRTSLVGDALDEGWMAWLSGIVPAEDSSDVSSLLLLRHLVTTGWVDEEAAVPIIQLPVEETRGAILKLTHARVNGSPLLQQVDGVPAGTPSAWRLGPGALDDLLAKDRVAGHHRELPSRSAIARSYAEARGRISSTELGSLVGATGTNVGSILKALSNDGVLVPSNPTGRGRGFYYRWVATSPAVDER